MDFSKADHIRCAAKTFLNEGNYLQSLEEFSKILDNHPDDQEALEGRISACQKLKLFHRCLKDIQTLSEIKPCDTKIHNLAGQIYEQIGACGKSVCAYLKAYLHEQQAVNRLETLQKIRELCASLFEKPHAEIPDKYTPDGFETLVMFSEQFAEEEKFDICLEVTVTAIVGHCLDKSLANAFQNELNVCSEKDNDRSEKTLKQLPKMSVEDSRNDGVVFERLAERVNSAKTSKSETDVRGVLSKSSLSNTNVIHSTTSQENKLYETASVVKSLHPSCVASQASVADNSFEQAEHHHSFTTQPTNITIMSSIHPQTISNLFLRGSECAYRLGKPETSLCFAKKLLQVSESFMDSVTVLKAYTQLGFLYTKYSEPNLAVLCYTKVRSKCRELLAAKHASENETEICTIEHENTLKLCMLLKDLGIYEDAEALLKEFFAEVEVVEQDNLMRAYGILGEIELAQKRYGEAISSYKTQLALCLKYNDREGLVLTHSKLGNAYQASGNNKTAMEWFEHSLHSANTVDDPFCLATACNCVGEGLIAQNLPREALTYFEKQLDLSTAIDQQTLRIGALFSIGKVYQGLRCFQRAEFFLKRALLEAKDWKLPLDDIAENLVRVLRTLGKHRESLKLLYEVRDHLEHKFYRISGYKIVTSHSLLDKLDTCVDYILVLLAEQGRDHEAFQLAERSNCVVLNQMLAYRAYVQGSQTISTKKYLDHTELYLIVSTSNKVVLYYRVVQNGFMVWIIGPKEGMMDFHWCKVPSSTPFRGMVEELMNGLLQPEDPLANYTCEHRKLSIKPQATSVTPQAARSRKSSRCSSRFDNTPDASTPRSKDSPQSRPISRSSTSKDFLLELSKLFIFPIEEMLTSIAGIRSHDLVIVNSSFLSIVPFSALHTSSGIALADVASSIQLLPCISVLRHVEENSEDSRKGISIIGNPVIKFPGMHVGFQGQVQPELLEKEIDDVAILLGTVPDVGWSATKEHFLRECSSSSLIHLSTYGSHDQGTIVLAPIADIDPRVVSQDSWEITLQDILASRHAPDVMVLNLGCGCRNQFEELADFKASLPLAFILAGVKTVVMPTWSTPQNALLSCLRQFYKNICDGLTVTCALSRAKAYVQEMKEFLEPVNWASFNVYGCCDSMINVEDIQHAVAEALFVKAQRMAVERFEFACGNEESSEVLLSQRLMETVTEFLHRHHQYPNLLPILLQVTHEAVTILRKPQSNAGSLPYREITPPWLPLIRNAEKFLVSIGFLIKTTNSRKTILVYPHWDRNDCLGRVESLLQCVLNILTYSPVLADALRAVLVQEEGQTSLANLRDVLQQRLECPYEIVEIHKQALLRMFWLRQSTRRLMTQLGFRKIGNMLEFRNSKDDRNAVKTCLKIFTLLTGFAKSPQIQPHPMLSKANLGASWMSYEATEEENKARYFLAESLDSIDARYKLAINDVRRLHSRVLSAQTKATESKKRTGKLDQARIASVTSEPKKGTKLPEIKTAKRQPLDLVKLGEKLTKVKVKSGSGPSSVRLPVEKEYPFPLVECVVKRHEATNDLYQCLGDIRDKKHEEMRKLLSL